MTKIEINLINPSFSNEQIRGRFKDVLYHVQVNKIGDVVVIKAESDMDIDIVASWVKYWCVMFGQKSISTQLNGALTNRDKKGQLLPLNGFVHFDTGQYQAEGGVIRDGKGTRVFYGLSDDTAQDVCAMLNEGRLKV